MKTQPLGTTGIVVPEVGFGAWQLGNANDFAPMSESDATHLVHAALDRGCNFFDTAPNYGQGASETLLGKALKGKRPGVVISSKFGHPLKGPKNFDASAMEASVDASLARLQTDYLDALLLHNPPIEVLDGKGPQFEMLRKLKSAGKIHSYGASVDWSEEIFAILNKTDGQVIELLFNIFHQEPTLAFEQALKHHLGIIVKVPLDSGWLSGRFNAQSKFTGIRARWSPEVIARRAEMLERIRFATDDGSTMTQAALRFVLAFPVISTVIPGVRDLAQLEENISAAKSSMPEKTVQRLQGFWQQNLKDNPLPW